MVEYIERNISIPKPGVYKKEELDISDLMQKVLKLCSDGRNGAVIFFIGIARRTGREGKQVLKIEMESYEEHANKAIWQICEETKNKYSLNFVGVWHLIGTFEVGESMVLAVAAGGHRDETFKGAREAVERYKREPALFKKEIYTDLSSSWIEGA